METKNTMKIVAVLSVVAAVGMFAYVGYASNMLSYLSEDPKTCINCHTMNTQYATVITSYSIHYTKLYDCAARLHTVYSWYDS